MSRSVNQRFGTLRDTDDQFFRLLDRATKAIKPALSLSKNPKTARALMALSVRAGVLKNGVFDMHETRNLYAARVLFRALTEHYLKAMYLFARYVVEKTDQVGTEYFDFCGAAEMIEYGEARRARGRLFGEDRLIQYTTLLDRFYPSIKSHSPKTIAAKSAQFKYRAHPPLPRGERLWSSLSEGPIFGKRDPFRRPTLKLCSWWAHCGTGVRCPTDHGGTPQGIT